MTPAAPADSHVLTLHPDPLVRAGVAAYLRNAGWNIIDRDPQDAGPVTDPVAIVVTDDQNGLRLADAAVRAGYPGLAAAKILVLTASDREADIRRAIEGGVHGYVLLGGSPAELVEAVATLRGGGRYLGRTVAQRMMDSLTHASLTSREMEVLQFVATGESNKAIARRLQIEVGTVKTHVAAILGKLDASSRTQAAAIAIARGLVEERAPAALPPMPMPMHSNRIDVVAQAA